MVHLQGTQQSTTNLHLWTILGDMNIVYAQLLILSFPFHFQYAIKIANNRNEKRLSAITELTSTMSITKLSNGNFLDGAEHTDADVSGNTNNNNNHLTNGDPSGDRHADPEDDMDRGVAGGAAGAVRTAAEDRLRLVSPALPPKIDTGQGRVERDRDRDWATTKVGPNHGVTLVNNNSSASGSATTTTVESGSGEGSKNSGSGGGNRPNHNHHPQQQPIAGNLALNKTNKNHVSHVSYGVKSDAHVLFEQWG